MVALTQTQPEDPLAGRSADSLVLVVAGILGAVIAAATLNFSDAELPVIVGVGTAGGLIVLLGLAAYRIQSFLVAILALRPGLDDIAQEELGLFQPVSTIGLLLLGVSTMWLTSRIRNNTLQPISSISKVFAAYAFTITLSAPASISPVTSMTGALKLWSAVALFIVLEQLYQDNRDSIWAFLGAAAVGLGIPIGTAIVQALGTGSVDKVTGLIRIDGPFVHPNPFATYLVIATLTATAIFLGSTGQRRIAAGLVVGACAPVIMLTYARAGWGALLLGLILIGRKLDRRLFAGLLLAGVLVIAANPSTLARLSDLTAEDDPTITYENPNSMEWRIGYWQEIMPLGYRNPVTGIGLDMVETQTSVQLPPHNTFVQAFVEAGILGFTGLVAVCLAMGRLIMWGLRRPASRIDTSLAVGSAAASLSFFVQLFTENLLTGVVPLWYLLLTVSWLSAERLRTASVQSPQPRHHPTQATRIGV